MNRTAFALRITDADDEPLTFRECMYSVFNHGRARVTAERPSRASVLDTIRFILGDNCNPRTVWARICNTHPDIQARVGNYTFPGDTECTPVGDVKELTFVINALPGRRAQQFRVSALNFFVSG